MIKGPKIIKQISGNYYPKLSTGTIIRIPSNETVKFDITEWHTQTTETDKKAKRIWQWLDQDGKVIQQFPAALNNQFSITLPKSLCGSYTYYTKVSLEGVKNSSSAILGFRGYCPQKITKAEWRKTPKGGTNPTIKYGDTIYLYLETEGLNGEKLTVEVYNQDTLLKDKVIRTIVDVEVNDGRVCLKIPNTTLWMGAVFNIQEIEEFYVKIKNAKGQYILNSKEEQDYAEYLKIKKEVVSTNIEKPTNTTAYKVGETTVKLNRYEPCKFDEIAITETETKDGTASTSTVKVFDNGKGLKSAKGAVEKVTTSIYFEFDVDVIDEKSKQALQNVLNFLLEHPNSGIRLEGYAYVIGKQNYNNGLSQRRSDAVKKFFLNGGLKADRMLSIGKGEVNATDDKQGRDNIKYKDEFDYIHNRRVDVSFTFEGHNAQTILYETIAPSSDKNILLEVKGFETKSCFKTKDKHTKKIKVSSPAYPAAKVQNGDKMQIPVHSTLEAWSTAPLNYIWPKYNVLIRDESSNPYNVFVHSCRYFSNEQNSVILIKVFPDIKWTLEFKWNHTQSFAYSFGNKLHPYDLKTAKKKALSTELDRNWSKNYGEAEQSFSLSLKAEWNRNMESWGKLPQKMEVGTEWAERIAKTLNIFNRIKKMTESVSNSPLAKGNITFEIKPPAIAFSAQWYLERSLPNSNTVDVMVVIGVATKPFVQADFTINLFKIFIESAGNAVCPGAGKVITWVMEKFKGNAGIHFLIIFSGSLNAEGKMTINTEYPKETKGEIKNTGKIEVTLEFKAWAKGQIAQLSVEGIVKANVVSSITGGVKLGADKKGIYACPIGEFGGIVATFIASGSVKFGVYKRSLEYESPPWVLVEKNEIKFEKNYI